jgi:hypothetical protein
MHAAAWKLLEQPSVKASHATGLVLQVQLIPDSYLLHMHPSEDGH